MGRRGTVGALGRSLPQRLRAADGPEQEVREFLTWETGRGAARVEGGEAEGEVPLHAAPLPPRGGGGVRQEHGGGSVPHVRVPSRGRVRGWDPGGDGSTDVPASPAPHLPVRVGIELRGGGGDEDRRKCRHPRVPFPPALAGRARREMCSRILVQAAPSRIPPPVAVEGGPEPIRRRVRAYRLLRRSELVRGPRCQLGGDVGPEGSEGDDAGPVRGGRRGRGDTCKRRAGEGARGPGRELRGSKGVRVSGRGRALDPAGEAGGGECDAAFVLGIRPTRRCQRWGAGGYVEALASMKRVQSLLFLFPPFHSPRFLY